MKFRIGLADEPTSSDRQIVFDLLEGFNQSRAGPEPERPLAVLIKDETGDQVLGGLWGLSYYGWLFIELLFVPEKLRGQGVGTRLVREAEAESVRRGCHGVWLETFSFQAHGFYQKLGYSVFGVIPDYPPGHSRIFMFKRLTGS